MPVRISIKIEVLKPRKAEHASSNVSCICSIEMPNFPLKWWRRRYSKVYFTMDYLVMNLKKLEFPYLD